MHVRLMINVRLCMLGDKPKVMHVRCAPALLVLPEEGIDFCSRNSSVLVHVGLSANLR